MTKTRKTRKEKIATYNRRVETAGFRVNPDLLTEVNKGRMRTPTLDGASLKFFRADLTKTFFLTMLVLALELALWQYLSKH